MRLLYTFLIVGVVLIIWFAVKIWTDRQTAEQLHEIDKWRSLPVEQRFSAHTDFSAQLVRKDGLRTQAAVTFSAAVVAIFALILAWVQDTVNDNRTEIRRACTADIAFRTMLDARLESQIRTQQQSRDDLVDSMLRTPSIQEDNPVFDALPSSVQAFVMQLLENSASSQQTRLKEMDDHLAELRAERTEIRQFNAEQDCPS